MFRNHNNLDYMIYACITHTKLKKSLTESTNPED